MAVHQATVKRAADKGILIEEAPEGSDYQYRAFWPERAMELWDSDAKALVDKAIHARMMTLEHGIKFDQEDDTITVTFQDNDLGTIEADCTPAAFKDGVIAALEEITGEMRAGASEEANEAEEEPLHSVVPEKYKQLYKEAGHAGNCGDWLAQVLIEHTSTNGQLDVAKLDAVAQANGVDNSKWNRTSNGWQGRLRMTTRNVLVRIVATKGVLVIDDQELKAPDAWVRANAPKVKEAAVKKIKAAGA